MTGRHGFLLRSPEGYWAAQAKSRETHRIRLDRAFWTKVVVVGECWEWTGSRNSLGYGQLIRHGRTLMASRRAYELVIGPIPAGHDMAHHCDNPPCVNPIHLFAATRHENLMDMARKGRGTGRLSPAEVRTIRAKHQAGESARGLARSTGASRWSIRSIVKGTTYAWVSRESESVA